MYFLWVMNNKFVFLIRLICQREALSGTRVIASLMFLQYHIWPICHSNIPLYLNAIYNLSPICTPDLTTLTSKHAVQQPSYSLTKMYRILTFTGHFLAHIRLRTSYLIYSRWGAYYAYTLYYSLLSIPRISRDWAKCVELSVVRGNHIMTYSHNFWAK